MFVWPIQIKRYIKIQIAVAFGLRSPLIAFSALHLYYVSSYSNTANMSQAIVPALVLQQCELLWSLISATIPTLKAFMKAFNSGFGMEIDLDSHYGQRSGPQDSKTYAPGSALRSATCDTSKVPAANSRGHHRCSSAAKILQESKVYNLTEETLNRGRSGPGRQGSFASDSSRDRIIKRETPWRLSYEEII